MPSPRGSQTIDALDPLPLLRFLADRGIDCIIIGGFAVNAHGFIRASKDLDIVPDPNRENLRRLAAALADLKAGNAESTDFDADEFTLDPTSVHDLAQGGNFRLETDLGELDIMQWVAGVDSSDLYTELDSQAIDGQPAGIPVKVCSLRHLRAMKQAAGRPRDLDDLDHLPTE
jgi:hypothetical protein